MTLAVTGGDSGDDDDRSGRRPSAQGAQRRASDKLDWSEAKGEIRTGVWDGQRGIPRRPRISPEEDERRKLSAVRALMGLSMASATSAGMNEGEARARIAARQNPASPAKRAAMFENQLGEVVRRNDSQNED